MTTETFIEQYNPPPFLSGYLRRWDTMQIAIERCEEPIQLLWILRRIPIDQIPTERLRRLCCRLIFETPLPGGQTLASRFGDDDLVEAAARLEDPTAMPDEALHGWALTILRRAAQRADATAIYWATYASDNLASGRLVKTVTGCSYAARQYARAFVSMPHAPWAGGPEEKADQEAGKVHCRILREELGEILKHL